MFQLPCLGVRVVTGMTADEEEEEEEDLGEGRGARGRFTTAILHKSGCGDERKRGESNQTAAAPMRPLGRAGVYVRQQVLRGRRPQVGWASAELLRPPAAEAMLEVEQGEADAACWAAAVERGVRPLLSSSLNLPPPLPTNSRRNVIFTGA
jgi:hypothetical protein